MKKEDHNKVFIEKELEQEKARKQQELIFYPSLQLFKQFKQLTNQSSQQIDAITQAFMSIPFFQKACPEDCPLFDFVKNALNFFQYSSYQKGSAIFHYGDPADRFYVILRGKLGVYVPRDEDNIKKDLELVGDHIIQNYAEYWGKIKDHAKIQDDLLLLINNNNDMYFKSMVPKFQRVFEFWTGQTFGEVALTNDSPRSATIIVMSDEVHMVSMSKHDFKKILVSKALNEKLDYFKKFFEDVGKFTLAKFIQYFHEIEFNPQTLLWSQGEAPEFFFIIRSGRVEIFKEAFQNYHKIPLQIAKNSKKKYTIATLSKDMFVGEEEILEQKLERIYSCKTLEVTSVFYMTFEHFNGVRKIFPQIVKALKEKYLIKQTWFQQRETSLKESEIQMEKQFEELKKPKVQISERRTVDQPVKLEITNGLSSKIPQHLPHNLIASKNEEIHGVLLKRTTNFMGDSMKKDFMMMQKEVIDQIQIRINQRFKKKSINANNLQRSHTADTNLLASNLKRKNLKKAKRNFDLEQFGDSIQITLNSSRQIESAKKASNVLLTRNSNPTRQNKQRLITSITNQTQTLKLSTLEDQALSPLNFQRIHSATDIQQDGTSSFKMNTNKGSSFQFVISPKNKPSQETKKPRMIKSAINFQFKTSNIHNMKIKQS